MSVAESIPVLEKELEKKRRQLKMLKAERARVAARLARLDGQIAALEGAPTRGAAKRPVRRRAIRRGATTLDGVIEQVLSAADKALSVAEIAEGAIAEGYKSASKNFRSMVAQYLSRSDKVRRVRRGRYTLKRAAKAAAAPAEQAEAAQAAAAPAEKAEAAQAAAPAQKKRRPRKVAAKKKS